MVERITLGNGRIRIQVARSELTGKLGTPAEPLDRRDEFWTYEVPYKLRNRARQLRILPDGIAQATDSEPDPTLHKLLRRANAWRQQLETGSRDTISDLATSNGVNASYFSRVLRIA